MDAFLEEQYKGYNIRIYQDEQPMSPRDMDNLGTMVCFHREYDGLGDKHDLKSAQFSGWEELQAYLTTELGAKFIKPLFLYDHSGLRIKIGSFHGLLPQGHAEFDSGQVGFIYTTDEAMIKAGLIIKDTTIMPLETLNKVDDILRGEVDTYDQYLRGEVYGYVISKAVCCDKCGNCEDIHVDSCWGNYGEPEKMVADCKRIIDGHEVE